MASPDILGEAMRRPSEQAIDDVLVALRDMLRIARVATMHSGGDHKRKRIARAETALARVERERAALPDTPSEHMEQP